MHKAKVASDSPSQKYSPASPLFRDRLQELDHEFVLQTRQLAALYRRLSRHLAHDRRKTTKKRPL